MIKNLKTGVVKHRYYIAVVPKCDPRKRKTVCIEAESLEAAKLRLPDGYKFGQLVAVKK